MKLTRREMFLAKVAPDPVSGCWLWFGMIEPSGYGVTYLNRRKIGAHRLAWVLFKGEIPAGFFVCHKCDVRACVNPDHLFLGTPADNSRDMKQKRRHQRGEQHAMSKLTEEQVVRIKAKLAENKLSLSELAREFDVSQTAIWAIKVDKTWQHVPPPVKESTPVTEPLETEELLP